MKYREGILYSSKKRIKKRTVHFEEYHKKQGSNAIQQEKRTSKQKYNWSESVTISKQNVTVEKYTLMR